MRFVKVIEQSDRKYGVRANGEWRFLGYTSVLDRQDVEQIIPPNPQEPETQFPVEVGVAQAA